jgi:small subunit ribosomal protein S3Ae
MVEVITKQAACSLTEMVKKFIPELLGKQIAKECDGIYPLKDVFIRKVTVKRAPKFDLARLMESHAGGAQAAAPAAAQAAAKAEAEAGDKVEAEA